jgi:hypothetical protein
MGSSQAMAIKKTKELAIRIGSLVVDLIMNCAPRQGSTCKFNDVGVLL